MKPSRSASSPQKLRVVALGASAGGLTALQAFFAKVPPKAGVAWIVVQHLDPNHPSLLSELLARSSTVPVCEAVDGQRLQADHVYVRPPDRDITVEGGRLHLGPVRRHDGLALPVDQLFASLARNRGPHAAGVVLSGMGRDGAEGVRALRRAGGLTLAQEPDSAASPDMPAAAVATGCVDLVALPGDMPGLLLARWQEPTASEPQVTGTASEPPESEDRSQALAGILKLLRAATGHDLTEYKSSTLVRRIERRMVVHGVPRMTDYADFLAHNPQECDLLFSEMLIGVTGFFRDDATWDELRDRVLPQLLGRRAPAEALRAWVVGCSTGEEAYSLVMLFTELTDAMPPALRPTLQVFATDLNAEAVAVARKGLYPPTALAGVSAARRARFFSPHPGGLQVGAAVRDQVLFAQHDVTRDPPFTRLDLLLCRNVLIYFRAALQHRLLPLFHYALKPGGVLLLGQSETVGRSQELFTPLSVRQRIYLRRERALPAGAVVFPVNRLVPVRPRAQESAVLSTAPSMNNLQSLADQVLLQTFSPPAVMVNASGDLVYISGRTGRFLEPAAGKANWNIHVMARPGLRTQLALALRQVGQGQAVVELHGLRVEDGNPLVVDVTVQALKEPPALQGHILIVFREDRHAPVLPAGAMEPIDASLTTELERARDEIQALRREMLSSREELQATNEALQSANEELQSANEELQSANEELTTSKEEAQSMNEELQTINNELQAKLDDLALAQSDMQNLLNSTDIATLFLDDHLNVRRFTERASSIFHLRESDIGRPLSDLASTLSYPELNEDARDTLRTLTTCRREVTGADGLWYAVRILPYRTLANVIQGVVVSLVDISASKALESRRHKG